MATELHIGEIYRILPETRRKYPFLHGYKHPIVCLENVSAEQINNSVKFEAAILSSNIEPVYSTIINYRLDSIYFENASFDTIPGNQNEYLVDFGYLKTCDIAPYLIYCGKVKPSGVKRIRELLCGLTFKYIPSQTIEEHTRNIP
jgi:hypothetical protein